MIVFDAVFGPHIAHAAGTTFNRDADTVIGRFEDGRLKGGVIFTGYTGTSIHMHTAGFEPGWINNDLIWAVFHYAFVQLGCKLAFAQVPDSNEKALEFNLKLGFKKLVHIDDVFPDGGLQLLRMRREECRWLKLRPRQLKEPLHGQQKQGAAAPGLYAAH